MNNKKGGCLASPLRGLPSRGRLVEYVPMEEQPMVKVCWMGSSEGDVCVVLVFFI